MYQFSISLLVLIIVGLKLVQNQDFSNDEVLLAQLRLEVALERPGEFDFVRSSSIDCECVDTSQCKNDAIESTNPKSPKPEPPKPESPKPKSPEPESPKPESPMPESPEPESPKPEPLKPKSPEPESPEPESPKPESPNPEPSFLNLIKPRVSSSCPLPSQVCCEVSKIICTCVASFQCADDVAQGVGACGIDQICCTNIRIDMAESTDRITCGASQGVVRRVFSGTKAEEREFPWFVAVLDKDQTYVFSGSLIHPQIVLTAAHRLEVFNNDLTVRIGSADLREAVNQLRNINSILIHPEYDTQNLYNDIGLAFLDSPVEMNLGISTICLPVNNAVYDKSACLSGGWGKDETDLTSVAGEKLRYVNLPLVEHATCESVLQTERLGSRYKLHGSFMCAGGLEADTCVGDGGSPLLCPLDLGTALTQFVQIGITAWGLDCGVEGVPGVYASLIDNGVQWVSDEVVKMFGVEALEYFTA